MSLVKKLNMSVHKGEFETIKQIVEEDKINVNETTDSDMLPHIALASMDGYTDIVKYLLDHGADPNLFDKNRRTALKSAAKNGFIDIVKLLLLHGADPNFDRYGDVALSLAAGFFSKQETCMDMVQTLIPITDTSYYQLAYNNCIFEDVRQYIKNFDSSITFTEPEQFGTDAYHDYIKFSKPPEHPIDLQLWNALDNIIENFKKVDPNRIMWLIFEQSSYSSMKHDQHDIDRIKISCESQLYWFNKLFDTYPETKEKYSEIYRIVSEKDFISDIDEETEKEEVD